MKVKRILASVIAVVVLLGGCLGVAVGYNELNQQIDELTNEVEGLTTANQILTDKTTEIETENKSLSDKNTELEEENKSLSDKVALLTTEVNAEFYGDRGVLKNEFIEENITHSAGCYYSIENNGTINIVRVESSTSYPKTRTYVIKDKTALNEAYFTAPEIDFEKEMLLIHFYTDICDNGAYFKMVKIDENNVLKIEYALEPDPPGLGGTSGPFQAILVVKVNKLDVSEVEFIYDNYYMDHIVEQNS